MALAFPPADWLLPSTQLRFAYSDSKCDSSSALTSALALTRDAFNGEGVSAIIGAACSGASVIAAQVAAGSRVPMVSPTATSSQLSDGKAYPYYLRAMPTDAFASVVMVDVLRTLFNYTGVALVHSTDSYGGGGGSAFAEAAQSAGLAIVSTQRFARDAVDFSTQQRALQQSRARVVVLYCQASDGSRWLRTSTEAGVGGEGYLYLGSYTLVDSGLWEGDAELAADTSLRLRVLKGFFSMVPNGQPQGSLAYQGYLARRRQLPHQLGDGTPCSSETDDVGTLLWAQDHDQDPSTPLACAGHDLSQDGSYDTFGYDAAFAVAHALHDLVEVQNRTEIVGSELLDTLIKRVSFEGVTGRVAFYDASSDPGRLYHGDRRVGFSYTLLNYEDVANGLIAVGSWTPCAAAGCAW